MSNWKTIAEIRREYGSMSLSEENANDSPIAQFEQWFKQVLDIEASDPTAMVLATVDENGYPDSRVVLLKGVEDEQFIFYTNYHSAKATQLNSNPCCALNFYWPHIARQVRIRGRVKKLNRERSDEYFSSRPHKSQLSAVASPQSQVIKSRFELEKRLNDLINNIGTEPVVRPVSWGGYAVIADEIEFWQGRNNRLHDRLVYIKEKQRWLLRRLAP
jgi:pyridoxamine 5'-phosphate oxidase